MFAASALNLSSVVTVSKLQVATRPPENGPGFAGIDANGDDSLSLEEFRKAAESIRDSGETTVSASVARTEIEASSFEARWDRGRHGWRGHHHGRHGGHGRFGGYGEHGRHGHRHGFEFGHGFGARRWASIAESSSLARFEEVKVEISGLGDVESDGTAEGELRAKALEAIGGGVDYDDAVERLFEVADADGDGAVSRDEFEEMKRALYGSGASENLGETSVTVTATQGYAEVRSFGVATGSRFPTFRA